jgi:phage-related protein
MSKPPPQPWTIEEYVAPNGDKPVLAFLLASAGKDKSQAIALLQLVRERGNSLRAPHSKAVDTGLFELRGHQVRIFYMFRPGRRVMLLDGMIKKQDEIPPEVLKRVRAMQQAVAAADRKAAGDK